MNARLTDAGVLRAAMAILGLAGLVGLALISGGSTYAQSNPPPIGATAASSAPAGHGASPSGQPFAATTSAQTASAKTAQSAAKNPAVKKAAPKGHSEGIQVHGHWVIEVRKPDGKVVTHREFENALVQGGVNDGPAFLASILGRVVTPGSWQISLFIAGNGSAFVTLGMEISEPGSPSAGECPSSTSTFTCSTTLSLTGPSYGIDVFRGETLTLSGSTTVPSDLSSAASPPQITLVNTSTITCANGATVTPASCSTSALAAGPLGFSFTSRTLDGNTSAGAAAGDPNPVAVAPGQTVLVTVIFSFQ